ncbi:hypothetical protein [Paraburkholderia tropica]|uniref:hypothetical protein n=1 Tax=Paraburkholderia tropica TaxID=92647 RepID=UPI002AB19C31|nr:hypothetical protein [Paraburkholderia tropica]
MNWKTRSLSFFSIVIVAGSMSSTHSAEPESLCSEEEVVYFSCKIERSQNYASICAKDNVSPNAGYVQYRFGKNIGTAFRFPETEVAPNDFFHVQTINHLRDGIGKHLTFHNGAYTYVISNAVQPPEIGVFRDGKIVTTKSCQFDGDFSPISSRADYGIKQGEKSKLDSFDGS